MSLDNKYLPFVCLEGGRGREREGDEVNKYTVHVYIIIHTLYLESVHECSRRGVVSSQMAVWRDGRDQVRVSTLPSNL